MELGLFDEVGEIVMGLVPPELGRVGCRAQRYGLKVWLDADRAPPEHYEAQVVGPRDVPGAEILAIEVGFHAEHRDPATNLALLDRLAGAERRWRRALGPEATAAGFLGREEDWARLSETWPDPDLSDPDMPWELASRLVDYIMAVEPVRRRGTGDRRAPVTRGSR